MKVTNLTIGLAYDFIYKQLFEKLPKVFQIQLEKCLVALNFQEALKQFLFNYKDIIDEPQLTIYNAILSTDDIARINSLLRDLEIHNNKKAA